MSISVSNTTLSSTFDLTELNQNRLTTMLKDLKINGRYIDKIYWCDNQLFADKPDYCGLIYKRYNNIIPITLSGHIYNLLTMFHQKDYIQEFQVHLLQYHMQKVMNRIMIILMMDIIKFLVYLEIVHIK